MTATVTLTEVATATHRKVDAIRAEAESLGMWITTDWAGRASLTIDDARSLADGSAKATRDHEQRWARHVASEKRWVEDRGAAAREAADKVAAAHRGPHDGESWSRANAAAVKAAAKYERTHPRPTFPGLPANKRVWP